MPKSRRLSRLWERRSWSVRQSLPVISKRLTIGLRSIITTKTDQHGPDMPRSESENESYGESHEVDDRFALDADMARKTPDAGEDLDAKNGHDHEEADRQVKTKAPGSATSVPSSSAQDTRKRFGEHHDSAPVNAVHERPGEHKTPAPSDISRKPSTKRDQDIIDWVNQQPGTAHLPDHGQDADVEQPPVFPPSRSGTGDLSILGDGFDSVNEGEPPSTVFVSRSWPLTQRPFHLPQTLHDRTGSQDPRTRVLRAFSPELKQDQFPSVSRRGTFDSQQRGVYTFQIPSTSSLAPWSSLSRRGSEGTVGTTVSGPTSDSTSTKRLSTSTISTTLTRATSSEVLRAQFKRLRPDSRAGSFRSMPTPPRLSSPHSSMTNSPRPSAPSPMLRDGDPRPYPGQPPIPALPASIGLSHDLPNYMYLQSLSPPQIVLEAGTLARERRGRHANPDLPTVAAGDGAEQPRLFVPCATDSHALSVINENASPSQDCNTSATALVDPVRPMLFVPCAKDNDALSVINEHASSSVFSREASPQESTTSASTVDDPAESDHISDDDTMSDVTDHTDLSLIEAFDASPTPFGPVLLSVLISLKEEVVDRIRWRLETIMLQSAGPQQRPMQDDSSGPSSSGSPLGNGDKTAFTTSLPTSRKRALDEDEGSNPGRRGDDNGEKRKRKDPTSRAELEERRRKFACPFYKKYPASEKLHKSCHGPGWRSVHRVKEHIYRSHQTPTVQCIRCQVSFANQEALDAHLRAERRCENETPSPDEEIIYITQSQERELRRKKKNVPEKKRWFDCFCIIFPGIPDDRLPSSPYYEIDQEPLHDSAVMSEFRAFLQQELPPRINADVNSHLRILLEELSIPEGMDMTEVIGATIREVMEEYWGILAPSSAAASPAASGHMGSTTTHWPLGGTTAPVGGPFIPFTNNTHTIHTLHTPPPLPSLPGRPPSRFPSPPIANTRPFHPSPPPRQPAPPPPAPWDIGPVFASPANSTLDLDQVLHHHQYAATDGAAAAQAPGSPAAVVLPAEWEGFDFPFLGVGFPENVQFRHGSGTST